MRILKIGLVASVACATFALSPPAMAERVIPPGNSAATQYTETLPTARGNATTKRNATIREGKRSPAEVLGPRTTRRLEKAAPEGSEVAELAAETAPTAPSGTAAAPAAPKESSPDRRHPLPSGRHLGLAAGNRDLPDGSSGIGRVVSAATGSSDSGDLGILLPIAILVALGGSAAYFWRHRRPSI